MILYSQRLQASRSSGLNWLAHNFTLIVVVVVVASCWELAMHANIDKIQPGTVLIAFRSQTHDDRKKNWVIEAVDRPTMLGCIGTVVAIFGEGRRKASARHQHGVEECSHSCL